jgi:Spx/MgsR family transcriptional regulator
MIIYGIKNCDTVKKAQKYLQNRDISYEFHDYKKSGIDKETLSEWCDMLSWQVLLNKRGTTWRNLSDDIKNSVVDKESAMNVMLNNHSIIKRPVLEKGDLLIVGFDEDQYSKLAS